MAEGRFVFRIRYAKQGDLRYISHLDLLRLWERAVRRAALPVRMSEGFNPRPRLSFPVALELGVAGTDEVLDLSLSEWLHPGDVSRRLGEVLPEGIIVKDVRTVMGCDSCQAACLGYRVPLRPGHGLAQSDVRALLSRGELPVSRIRKGREIRKDIRPFIRSLTLHEDRLEMIFEFTQTGTARPEEVLAALGCRQGDHYRLNQIVRTRVALVSPS